MGKDKPVGLFVFRINVSYRFSSPGCNAENFKFTNIEYRPHMPQPAREEYAP